MLAPAAGVASDPVALLQFARDLADRDAREPEQREKAVSACYAIPVVERVWRCASATASTGANLAATPPTHIYRDC